MHRDKISNYLNGSATSKEKKEVEDWICSSPENIKKFNLLKARHIASTFAETAKITNIDKAFDRYKDNIVQSSRHKIRNIWSSTLKYAAMVAVVFGAGYLYYIGSFNTESISIPKDAITLKLDNGNIQVIKEDGTTEVMNSKGNTVGTQQGTQLVYTNGAASEKLAYNTLTVPYGKRFDLILSDSTHILLNAGTSLKYPVKFIKGHNREVSLTGEAFFEVAKDAAHPFIVNTNGLKIRVLGTKFNVSAYPEDNATNTVLVEGSVALYQEDAFDSARKTFLTPGHLASLNRTSKDILVKKAEISLYTAWTNGNIIFRHVSFKNIIKKLERHYNVIITNNNKALDEELFTASFDHSTIEQVLKTFKDNYGIDYTIDNDKITIKP